MLTQDLCLHMASLGQKKLILMTRPWAGGGGTHYVRVIGRLRGIDPPFFKTLGKNIDFRPPFSDIR